jgi:hypothetical protein
MMVLGTFSLAQWFWCLVSFEGLNLGIFLVGLRVEKKFAHFFLGLSVNSLVVLGRGGQNPPDPPNPIRPAPNRADPCGFCVYFHGFGLKNLLSARVGSGFGFSTFPDADTRPAPILPALVP